MKGFPKSGLSRIIFLVASATLFTGYGPGGFHRGFYGRGHLHPWYRHGAIAPYGWHSGHWFHGGYGGRFGWWWIAGPDWYYYSAPIYPYPPMDGGPVYYVPAPDTNTPPPPPTANGKSVSASPKPGAPTPAPGAMTYYCEKSKGYYPAITDCPAGWIVTPVNAPPK